MINLTTLNQMSADDFVTALAGVFEHSPWIAEAAASSRPFPSVEALHAALVGIVLSAPPSARRGLLEAHPELAGKAARAKQLTAASTAEQAGAGLDRLDAEESARFDALNAAYRGRFGFPFIIAVRGQRDRRAITAALETRMAAGETEEIETALGEVAKIAWFRLSDLVQP